MGTRPGPIIPGLPTLVVDHHSADRGSPDGVLLVNGYDREPVAPASVLGYVICRDLPGNEHSAWLAALGAIADLGTTAPFASLIGFQARGSAWPKAVSLLNAARRAPEDDAETALRVLQRATGVRDIVDARDADVARLEAYRRAVQAEVARASRVPPQIYGDAALLRFARRPGASGHRDTLVTPAGAGSGDRRKRRLPVRSGEFRSAESVGCGSAEVAQSAAVYAVFPVRIRQRAAAGNGRQPAGR